MAVCSDRGDSIAVEDQFGGVSYAELLRRSRAVASGVRAALPNDANAPRVAMLVTLANLTPQPESVPVNALVAVSGTPLSEQSPVDSLELVRMCATARIMMPNARVRLSAGRASLSRESQLLCFMAGANSIFFGDKLLTTGNPDHDADLALLRDAGLSPLEPEQGSASDAAE